MFAVARLSENPSKITYKLSIDWGIVINYQRSIVNCQLVPIFAARNLSHNERKNNGIGRSCSQFKEY
jgi:hypothetical protein